MRVLVRPDSCQGCGMCEAAAPEVFRVDDAGQVTLLIADVPESLADAVEDAVDSCPTETLELQR